MPLTKHSVSRRQAQGVRRRAARAGGDQRPPRRRARRGREEEGRRAPHRVRAAGHGQRSDAEALRRARQRVRPRQAAREKKDSAAQAQAELEYDKLKKQIRESNLSGAELEGILTLENKDVREKRLSELRERSRLSRSASPRSTHFTKASDAYSGVKGSLDDASDASGFARLGRARVSTSSHRLNTPDAQAMVEAPQQARPQFPQARHDEVAGGGQEGRLAAFTHTYNDRDWVWRT
jgi:hypothetical protein